jgi:DNA-binding transcriptional MerR regulator
MQKTFTVPGVAKMFGVPVHRVRRLFTTGKLPDTPRVGMNRLLSQRDLRRIEKVLRQSGSIGDEADVAVVAK